jgi:hypothetical protein
MTNLTKKNKTPHNKTLKSKINKYIFQKQDICCEDEINKEFVIQDIFEKYKTICKKIDEPDEYLNYINNDLVKFIGYRFRLKNNNDMEGVKLWDELNKNMIMKDKNVSQKKVELLLFNLPLYYLLSFLGYASYRLYTNNNLTNKKLKSF